MFFSENYPLDRLNTLHFSVSARFFACVTSEVELQYILENLQILQKLQNPQKSLNRSKNLPICILGGGSNIVFTKNFPGLVIHIAIMGKELLTDNALTTTLAIGAGENWHNFVAWTIKQGWPGLENLALIPGTVGAAPLQNIGAYGVEMAKYCSLVRAYDMQTKTFIEFKSQNCKFGYRDSLFKQNCHYIITRVHFLLPKIWHPQLEYRQLMLAITTKNPSPDQIFNAICKIRKQKLPEKILGNVGSFFKNPTVTKELVIKLIAKFPQLPNYAQTDGSYKLAAAWLIEQCGFKGFRISNVGVYEKQALVLVNFGGGYGSNLLSLAAEIQAKVTAVFQTKLTIEPSIK